MYRFLTCHLVHRFSEWQTVRLEWFHAHIPGFDGYLVSGQLSHNQSELRRNRHRSSGWINELYRAIYSYVHDSCLKHSKQKMWEHPKYVVYSIENNRVVISCYCICFAMLNQGPSLWILASQKLRLSNALNVVCFDCWCLHLPSNVVQLPHSYSPNESLSTVDQAMCYVILFVPRLVSLVNVVE